MSQNIIIFRTEGAWGGIGSIEIIFFGKGNRYKVRVHDVESEFMVQENGKEKTPASFPLPQNVNSWKRNFLGKKIGFYNRMGIRQVTGKLAELVSIHSGNEQIYP